MIEPVMIEHRDPASPGDAASSGVAVLLARLDALVDGLAETDLTRCSDTELVEVAQQHERLLNRLTYAGDRQLVEISDRGVPRSMGYRSLPNFLNTALRVSDPRRRLTQIAATSRLRQLDGQLSEPKYPTLGALFAAGAVGPAHLRAVIDMLDTIPTAVAHDKKVAAEHTLADLAGQHTPAEIATLGARVLAHLDPDGVLTDDRDRRRRRNLWLNRQSADHMSKVTGHLDPETRGMLDVVLAAWAAPGLNNPDDPTSPTGAPDTIDPDTLKAAADRDTRSQAQRNHDALSALLKAVLTDGMLGKTHRGLPIQLIIKADLADLQRAAGLATTASGSLIPIADVIRLATQVDPWLAVFDTATAIPLFFGRGKRFATTPQRLVSFARPDGECCSAPGCDQPATQVERDCCTNR